MENSTILQFFPYDEARDVQTDCLLELERLWDSYDVFVLVAPTATGKSAIAKTLMGWKYGVSLTTPTNLLVDQFVSEFPDTPKLKRMDSYWCKEWKQPCVKTRNNRLLKKFCRGCECSHDLATAKYKNGPGVYTYHTYMFQEITRKVLICDEAHNIARILCDLQSKIYWKHDYKYPDNLYTSSQIREWIGSLTPAKQKTAKMQTLLQAVTQSPPRSVVQRTQEWFGGKGTKRGEPELRDCIKTYPIDPSPGLSMLLPPGVAKIILMSGTINRKDIDEVGFGRGNRRVCYINCTSPIPPRSRPIIASNLVTVNRSTMESSVEEICQYIQEELLPRHIAEKGVVHATYQMSQMMQSQFTDPRFMFHTRQNKTEVYQKFRDSPVEEGRVLVACGMYEGIDLPEDLGRWQVVAKIPWKSLADPAVTYKAKQDPEWYSWQALRDLIQATGRICRTPEDFGRTYLLDWSFWRLYSQSYDLIPEWWLDALDFQFIR